MDLESEGSALESVEENEVNLEKSPHDDENGTKNNGSFANEIDYEFGGHGHSDANTSTSDQLGSTVEAVGEEVTHRRGKVHAEDSSPASKGSGLKKWRRIRREIVKDPNVSVESKTLKRGLPDPANLSNSQPLAHDIKQSSEDSVISSNIDNNVGLIDASTILGSGSDSDFRYVLGAAFAIGTDSENSEDRSNKCSSATSTPKFRHDMSPVSGLAQEKRRVKNMSSKNLASSTQRVQLGRERTEISKKPKGEKIKMEKENSHSSPSLRSSNFNQGVFEANENGKHDRRSIIYDKIDSGEVQTDEKSHGEVQAGYCNETEDHLQGNLPANLSSDVIEEKGVNNHYSEVGDPLMECMRNLQSVQEALEEEIKKFGEIRNEPLSSDYDSIKSSNVMADITALDPGLRESCLSGQSDAEGTKPTYSSSLELQILILTQKANVLESKLNELQGMLALRDSRIHELATVLGSHELPTEESGSTVNLLAEKFKLESELEGFFRQKIEAEIEYLIITKMMQNFKVAEAYQHRVLEELETSSKRQAQVLNKLGIAESKAAMLKNKADELGNYCSDILGVEETITVQKRLYKVTLCFLVQFMLLVMVFRFFVSQLLPTSGVVVIPT
ncbi:WPP domain-interacting protein 1 isoform X1 [Neltuma alba]|uniref:WPP domain-interacting protein 1 isoform X1 n=1 Tax=Neltuma alba TaxID=207710 RepID=UPI0010A4D35A|nr:WPP domain-interacting protein 1-like isoform X1 [Prosopis alba]XP_028753049.1 WPP domain-interacting protein 1-like isoform X1 [Prosopis alba]